MERGGAGHDLHVALARPELERGRAAGQGTGHVEEQTGRQHRHALALDLGVERDAEADLHVGGTELGATVLRQELDTRERLHRTAGGGDAGDRAELREQGCARRRQLQLVTSDLIWKGLKS